MPGFARAHQPCKQNLVGASLGRNRLKRFYGGLIGTLIIIVFMIVYYRVFGIFAAIALIIYIFLSLAILNCFQSR